MKIMRMSNTLGYNDVIAYACGCRRILWRACVLENVKIAAMPLRRKKRIISIES